MIRLDDGSHFRMVNQQGQDVTTADKAGQKGLKLQIDTDKDGRFDGKNDVTISEDQLAPLLDNKSGNASTLKNVPFVDEIESHLLKANEIQGILKQAKAEGLQAKETSAVFKSGEKIKHGKAALQHTKAAYQLDPANPLARFAFGTAVYKISDSFWKDKAQKAMDLDVDSESKNLIGVLEKDKQDILGQMLLERLYSLKPQSDKQSALQAHLSKLQKDFPQDYAQAKKTFDQAMSQ